MSRRMQVGIPQMRHSNIAVVRVNGRNGKKVEVACYKNKVIAFRNGTETSVEEVLQVERVFTDVARGSFASNAVIKEVLGEDFKESKAILHILKHGELQVSQAERVAEVDEMLKEICTMVSEKCVHSATGRPFPLELLLSTSKQMGFGVKLDHPVKKQALQFMHQLIESQVIPIRRAPMLVRCNEVPVPELRAWIAEHGGRETPSEEGGVALEVDPSLFRELDTFATELGGTVQVMQAAVMVTTVGDADDFDAAAEAVPPPPLPVAPKPKKEVVQDSKKEADKQDAKAAKRAQRKANRKATKAAENKKDSKKGSDEDIASSDEELMLSKKERAERERRKLQEQQANNNFDDEDEFDYGDEDEEDD